MKQDAREALRIGEPVLVEGWSYQGNYRGMLNQTQAVVMIPNGQDVIVDVWRISRQRGLDGDMPL